MTAPTKKSAPTNLQQLAGILEEIECSAKDELSRVMSCVSTIRSTASSLESTSLEGSFDTCCPEIVIQAVSRDAGEHSDLLWMVLERIGDVAKEMSAANAGAGNASVGGAA